MPEASGPSPKIIVKLNDSVLKEVRIDQGQLTIGRKPDNDLVIEHATVSGHHARVVKVQKVYFLEDLTSTNGTFINDKRVDRQQLRDTDVVAIGKHRMIFREETPNGSTVPPAEAGDPDRTMVLKSPRASDGANAVRKIGVVQIVSGATDRNEYHLTSQLTVIGSQPNAAIKLKGWFAPKTAAIIGRRGDGYVVSASDEARTLRVNRAAVAGQAELQDGDLLEIGKVKMYFYLKTVKA